MPLRYQILPEKKLIVVRFEREIREEDVIAASQLVCADPRYQHGYNGLIDLRKCSSAVRHDQIQKLVEYTLSKRKHGHGKWAVIVDSPAATAYAMIYHHKVVQEHPFAIFCSLEGAADFLEQPIDSKWMEENLSV